MMRIFSDSYGGQPMRASLGSLRWPEQFEKRYDRHPSPGEPRHQPLGGPLGYRCSSQSDLHSCTMSITALQR